MSDFLDRLAARAIGGEATLAPRLPSLFEPSAHAPILPPIPEDATATARRATAPADDTPLAAEPLRPPSPQPKDASRPAPVEPTVARRSAPVAASVPEHAMPATTRAAPPPTTPVTATLATLARMPPSEPVPAEPASTSRVQPRQTRIAPPRIDAPAPSGGVLLPPSAAVFATSHITPASERANHTAAMRPRTASAAERVVAASEPVVHVSIGRLEVRAAPAAAAPSRHRDEPRPTSLDDYLRQRGGKAAP